jgi:hypothetical protein
MMNGKGKPKHPKKSLLHCHFVHQEFLMACPDIEFGHPGAKQPNRTTGAAISVIVLIYVSSL